MATAHLAPASGVGATAPSWADSIALEGKEALISLATLGVAVGVGWALSAALNTLLARWSRRTNTRVDDAVVRHLRGPVRWLGPIWGLKLAIALQPLPAALSDVLDHGTLLLLIGVFGWAGISATNLAAELVVSRFDLSQTDNLRARSVHTQARTLRNIAVFVMALLTVAFALMTFERVRQVGAGLLASAGVAGVVLGFAAQRSIATLFAGVQLAITQPIRVDDVVIVEGEWGRIEEITLTFVVVRIWDLRRLVVPVTYFLERPFQNWTRGNSELLGTVELFLDYSVPVDALRAELKRILDASPLWDHKTWGIQVTDARDRTILVRALVSAADASLAWDLRCEVREKLIGFVQRRFPHALPRFRADVSGAAEPPAAAPQSPTR
jgi:small-conductance mechanosensitive channel